jgi:cytosine/creatinine deaminase
VTERKLTGNAIEQARKSLREGGIPIGFALACEGKLLSAGHNRRVQDNDRIAHAELVACEMPDGLAVFSDTVLFSTLIPCYLCAGAVVQFGIRKIIVGDRRTLAGVADFMRSHGAKLIDLDLQECAEMMTNFMAEHPQLWDEDIGR